MMNQKGGKESFFVMQELKDMTILSEDVLVVSLVGGRSVILMYIYV